MIAFPLNHATAAGDELASVGVGAESLRVDGVLHDLATALGTARPLEQRRHGRRILTDLGKDWRLGLQRAPLTRLAGAATRGPTLTSARVRVAAVGSQARSATVCRRPRVRRRRGLLL